MLIDKTINILKIAYLRNILYIEHTLKKIILTGLKSFEIRRKTKIFIFYYIPVGTYT